MPRTKRTSTHDRGLRIARLDRLGSGALLVIAAAAGLACAPSSSREASSEAPRELLEQRSERELARADLIEYRTLRREDFRSVEPPTRYRGRTERLAASTCALLVPRERPRFRIEEQKGDGYRAVMLNVGFRAVMDRDCSWWNAESGVAPDYVLAHEQVHFAIVELLARRLNRLAASGELTVTASADSIDAAVRAARDVYARALEQALRETRQRHEAFDHETSLGEDRLAQARWVEQIDRELLASDR